jgi:CheY-like chemotaxis protein
MIRNALDHGIETPMVRLQAGKPEVGSIRLQALQEGARVIITLKDDGRGLDPQRLKQVAIDNGFLDEGEAVALSEDQLLDLVFLPGFSTRATVTDVSGRGVGMDVVHANVASLKGEVNVASESGQGTTFVISLPLTLATVHALLVACDGEILAIPTNSVARVLQLPVEQIRFAQGSHAVIYQGNILRVRSLREALGWQEEHADLLVRPRVTLVVLQSGERRVGFLVEEILGEREIVVKDLGSHLNKVQHIAGATILGSGTVGLILDVPQMLWQEQPVVRQELPKPSEDQNCSRQGRVILMVEDQVVTRHMEKGILEAAGYQVITAENGVDALNKLKEQSFDLVVTDIEMPKMDGFTLAKKIRANEQTRDLPVVIVTSMAREQDRRRGVEVGADAYLVKSNFDQRALIATIDALLEQSSHGPEESRQNETTR